MIAATRFDELRWKDKAQRIVFRHTAALSLLTQDDAQILDIGCGDGLLFSLIAKQHPQAQCTGVDFSHTAIAHARENAPSATYVVLNAIDAPLPFADGAFDVVIALDVLEHVFMPETLLAEMKRVSRRAVIVGVPNFSSLPARLQALFGRVPENNSPKKGHVYWFNYRVLSGLLAGASLRVTAWRMNYPGIRNPLVGAVMRRLLPFSPNLLALSFVVRAEKETS